MDSVSSSSRNSSQQQKSRTIGIQTECMFIYILYCLIRIFMNSCAITCIYLSM